MMKSRVVVIGLDGASYKILQKFISDGKLQNISSFASHGVISEAIPSVPAFTPTNWATISTGANPGTHGVFTWGTHKEGEPLDENHFNEAMMPVVCKAEYIWETAANFGKKSALLNYIGYPSGIDSVYHVDWLYQPDFNYFELAPPALFTMTREKLNDNDNRNSPSWGMDFLSGSEKGRSRFEEYISPSTDDSGVMSADVEVQLKHVNQHIRINLRGYVEKNSRFVKISSLQGSVDPITIGQWSDWMFIETSVGTASMRWKLISFDDNKVRIYRSSVFVNKKFCIPEDIGVKLYRSVGPYISDDVGKIYLKGEIDKSTFLEESRYKIRWIADAIKFLIKIEDVSLIMLHWHYIDSLQHHSLGFVDISGEDYRDGKEADHAMDMLLEGYQLADELVGEIVKTLNENDTVIIVSDHGNLPNNHRVSLYNLFQQKGWCKIDVVDGIPKVDMRASKIYYNLSHVYVNLKGRDPQGVVENKDYFDFREEVRQALLSIKDPDTGNTPFLSVLTKEEAKSMGIWGPGTGDLFLIYNSGYVWSGPEVVLFGEKRVVWPDGGANHGSQPPTGETAFSSNSAIFLMTGPGVKKGYKRERPIRLLDISPTISKVLDIPPPRQSEGTYINDLFVGNSPYNLRTKAEPMYPLVRKAVVPKSYQGDVTDEDNIEHKTNS